MVIAQRLDDLSDDLECDELRLLSDRLGQCVERIPVPKVDEMPDPLVQEIKWLIERAVYERMRTSYGTHYMPPTFDLRQEEYRQMAAMSIATHDSTDLYKIISGV